MRNTTPSFVCELEMCVKPGQAKTLEKRFEAGRNLYNAVLGESFKRLKLMRESKAYQKARKLPKGKERNQTFEETRKRYKFREYDLHEYAKKVRDSCWIGNHLDSLAVQKVATRAFQAAEQFCFGKRGKPRFKGRNRGLRSLEGKNNASGIRFRDGKIIWKGEEFSCKVTPGDPVIEHALSCPVKYNRILHRKIRGKDRWFAQLVLEGTPYVKEKNRERKSGEVGLDVNVSGVAVVSEEEAHLLEFASGLKEKKKKEIRRTQRQMDRQRRTANPDNYNPDGTAKKGKRAWNSSKSYLKNRDALAEFKRREAVQRKTENNWTVNKILKMGNVFKLEKTSKRSWQRNWGKSVGRRGPGGFETTLASKAERAGSKVVYFPTGPTKLSRTCVCGRVEEKPLEKRWHICECGVVAQRDLFSAFLARFVEENNNGFRLDTSKALRAWKGAEPLLFEAVSSLVSQRASGRSFPPGFGILSKDPRRQSLSLSNPEGPADAGDAVTGQNVSPVCESPGKAASFAGTPRL